MKPKYLLIGLAILIVAAGLIFAYLEMSQERAADAAEDQPILSASSVEQTNGVTRLHLNLAAQQAIGLQTAPATAGEASPQIQAYGTVLDPAALAVPAGDVVSSEAALKASRNEYQRLKSLAGSENVSIKALEDAEAAMKHDQAALATARAELTALTGAAVVDQPNFAAFIASLLKAETLLVRLDVPAGESPGQLPVAATVFSSEGKHSIPAHFLGRAGAVDPQTQGRGFLFLVTNDTSRLAPGLAISGFLQMPGPTVSGVIVPEAAVIRAAGKAWAYAQTGATNFVRQLVPLDQPVGGGWFVTNGIAPGQPVVVVGAQALLSEERKSLIQIED